MRRTTCIRGRGGLHSIGVIRSASTWSRGSQAYWKLRYYSLIYLQKVLLQTFENLEEPRSAHQYIEITYAKVNTALQQEVSSLITCIVQPCSPKLASRHGLPQAHPPAAPRSLQTICTCQKRSGAWASHRINLAIPRDELQQRQRGATEFWGRQLRSESSAGVNATPQHEPFWSVLPSDAVNHQRSCDCELEITSPDTVPALQPSRHPSRFLNARKGPASFFLPAASTLPCSPRPVEHALTTTLLTASFSTGPGQQLRNTPSNMFQVRQNENRQPLGTNRLQNGKLGEETSFEYVELRR
jgi:hypothetical protein